MQSLEIYIRGCVKPSEAKCSCFAAQSVSDFTGSMFVWRNLLGKLLQTDFHGHNVMSNDQEQIQVCFNNLKNHDILNLI